MFYDDEKEDIVHKIYQVVNSMRETIMFVGKYERETSSANGKSVHEQRWMRE